MLCPARKEQTLLILTEKPSVAKDFSSALGCSFSGGVYKNAGTTITYCVGHLFKEESPQHYGSDFPVIPDHWDYRLPDDKKLARQATVVVSLLKSHKNGTIIIATDADREGEIIARECLLQAGITDFSKIKRFWVSQALTKEVVLEGLKKAKPLSEYNFLAEQGFARQHADWLVGMNFCRYISDAAKTKLAVGRVQTAILSAIEERCDKIKNFTSERYFEHYGLFRPTAVGSAVSCRGIYFEGETTGFKDDSQREKLKSSIGKSARLIDSKTENKVTNPPRLYNLNAAQKDAFKFFGYSADRTLKIIQALYEEKKCLSYPRTPSRVMGSENVELCRKVADELLKNYAGFEILRKEMNISLSNKRCFDDAKLEAHHALIPLKPLPEDASEEEKNIYALVLERFFIAFLPEEKYKKLTYILDVDGNHFRICGKEVVSAGWQTKSYSDALKYSFPDRRATVQEENENEEEQSLENINWSSLVLSNIETKEKWTRPPAFFNEASILSFMENPKATDRQAGDRQEPSVEDTRQKKLAGLGTAATRHTFIPLLLKRGYIAFDRKSIICTDLGSVLLKAVRSSAIKSLADVSTTTDMEQRLEENPKKYLEDIKSLVRTAVKQTVQIEVPAANSSSGISCPLCKKEIRKGKSNWYCTGYKNGCRFVLWETVAGAKLTEKDIAAICAGKQTGIKHCTSKAGKNFDCRFVLDEEKKIKFVFEER